MMHPWFLLPNDCWFALDLKEVCQVVLITSTYFFLRWLPHLLSRVAEAVPSTTEREFDLVDVALPIQSRALGYLMTPHDAWHPKGPLIAETLSPWSLVLEILMMCLVDPARLQVCLDIVWWASLVLEPRWWWSSLGWQGRACTSPWSPIAWVIKCHVTPLLLLWGWRRAPWTWRVGMEWLYRLAHDPRGAFWSMEHSLALITPFDGLLS